ncbi:protein yippee-like 4 isoform X1 [Parus major]|uniref:protein yippee-like 4 isoform X1 n=1 Tax=Parus major TaxID=9157 RepID=UPI00077117BA|nr:protein yippee-like 4 isoform X1 [Parus major]
MPPPTRRHLPPAARLPPRTFRSYLPRSHRTYSCVHCRAHLARHEELISKSFQGSHGRAYLFNSVVNVGCGPAEQRLLLTGLHSVADIFCQSCKTTLGWKYVSAPSWDPPPAAGTARGPQPLSGCPSPFHGHPRAHQTCAGDTPKPWGGQRPSGHVGADTVSLPPRSRRSRAAKSTRRGSSSSKCRTW